MPKPGDFTYDKHVDKCFVTGWGRRTESSHIRLLALHDDYYHVLLFPASEHSLVMKEINVPLWNHDNCNGALQAQFGPAYTLPPTTLCAGAEGRDACDVRLLLLSIIKPIS